MNALRIIAFLTLGLAVAHSKGTKPNHRIVSKVKAQEENDCEYYLDACLAAVGCYWDYAGEGGLCAEGDGATWTPCCIEITTTTTPAPTTPAPTPAPTCLSTSDRRWACESYSGDEDCCDTAESCIYYQSTDTCETTEAPTPAPTCPIGDTEDVCAGLDEDCCVLNNDFCQYSTSDLCASEGGAECCEVITTTTTTTTTTETPTTDAPTTATPTTATPTTATPTTATPTTATPTTATPTTDTPTTDTPTTDTPTTDTPTTDSPTTDSPTTPSPTTPSPTTTTPSPEAATTETVEIPTPNPTMHSAAKWEMLHPAYKGGDGELMWQVYYGDFSDDARFDDFRKEQLWDANVIRPIIDEDAKFERYQAVAVEAHSSSTSSIAQYSAYLWALFASLAVISALVFWCRSRNGGYAKLVDTETDLLLDSTRKQNEVYSN